MSDLTPVIFRKSEREIVAVFPYDPGDISAVTMGCYAHFGQHAACAVEWYRTTKPATPEEYADLKRELEAAPYEYRFKVLRRIPSDAYAQRRANLGQRNT